MNSVMNDPLLLLSVATTLLFAAILIPQRRMNWPLWLRAAWGLSIFIALSFLLRQIAGSPLHPHYETTQPGVQFWQKIIEAGWWMMGARGAIGLIRLVVFLEQKPHEPQIVSDLLAAAIYVSTFLAIVDFVFAVPIGGLLATSGIIAIVLGLALQSTLADVFSGIAVGIERPFRPGDLIAVEGGIEGNVTQVTWRSIHISTGNNNIAVVPNSVIAKARLENHSLPTPIRSDSVEVRLDPRIAPEHCLAVLTAATKSCRLLLANPAPSITCASLSGDGNVFKAGYSIASSSQILAARTELLTEIHRHLRYEGIALAVAGTVVQAETQVPGPARLLELSELFGMIELEHRELLAKHFELIALEPGTTLIRQGGTPEALYLVASGVAEVTVAGPDGPRVVHMIRPGETLGAIGLITGVPYAATATALTPLKAYRLDKDAIAAAVKAQPGLAKGLEVLAKRGQAALRRDAGAHESDMPEHPEMFLPRLRNFLLLLNSR